MCDTRKCAACRPQKKVSVLGELTLAVVEAVAMGGWWLVRKVIVPGLIVLGWSAFVWLSGRTWRHAASRYVRREVRATGNWLVSIAVAALVWQPVATGITVAVLGASLVTTALAWRHREQLAVLTGRRQIDREPIRVQAEVGQPRRLTSSEGG